MTPRTHKQHRRITHTAGKRAEWMALIYLMLKGYFPVAQRYKCSAGEIDLIVARRNLVVFTEVKYRADRETAAYSISTKQQSRIFRAAQYWVQKNQRDSHKDMRFDVVLLSPWRWPQHIEHAFVDNGAQ